MSFMRDCDHRRAEILLTFFQGKDFAGGDFEKDRITQEAPELSDWRVVERVLEMCGLVYHESRAIINGYGLGGLPEEPLSELAVRLHLTPHETYAFQISGLRKVFRIFYAHKPA